MAARFVKCAAKSTASHYFAVLLRCSLAMVVKQLRQAARVVPLVVHGVEQRHIAPQGTTVNVVLRKYFAAHCHCARLESGL